MRDARQDALHHRKRDRIGERRNESFERIAVGMFASEF
jgi:hypothetical protein